MAIERYNLTFIPEMANRPIVYSIGANYDIVPVIERAQLSENAGWMQIALNGDKDEIQRAVADLLTKGVLITPVHLSAITTPDNALP
ncbi:MAG TPA: NIL domain-containing protein [Capsulimonadaceae bacterium]|nr:NIL domain-containing protein [Capsulimonadaceae bacterium]